MTELEASDPAVWRGPEMAHTHGWLYPVSDHEIAEIEAAVAALRGRHMIHVSRDDFPCSASARYCGVLQKT